MSAPDTFPNSGNLDDKVRNDAADLTQTARQDLSDLGHEAKEQAKALGDEAKAQIGEMADKAKGMAADQKDMLAEHLDGVSSALERVAGEMEEGNDRSAGTVRFIADGASRLTSTIRDNDVDQILAIAQDFGRKQPVAFLGAAALLGFAATRFLNASAARREQPAQNAQPPYDRTYGDDYGRTDFDRPATATGQYGSGGGNGGL
jgi:gas vesicle protein